MLKGASFEERVHALITRFGYSRDRAIQQILICAAQAAYDSYFLPVCSYSALTPRS